MGRGWSLSLAVWLWVCRRQGRAGVSLHQWDLWHGLDPNPPALCQAIPGHRLELGQHLQGPSGEGEPGTNPTSCCTHSHPDQRE